MIATMVADTSSARTPAATMTFLGPDENSHIRAVNEYGIEVTVLTVCNTSDTSFTIFRYPSSQSGPVTICTGSESSGSIDMIVHGQTVRHATTSAGLATFHEVLETPMLGTLTWSSSGSRTYHLKGSGNRIVARADLPAMRFTVYVPGDDMMLDCLLAGWIGLIHKKEKKGKGSAVNSKGVEMAFKIIGHLAGGVGGAGS